MNLTQATAILVMCSGYDNRKVTPENAKAWQEVLDGVRFEDAQQAVLDHYRTSDRWLMPADIHNGVARMVKDRQAELHMAELPAELAAMEDGPEFNAAYLQWVKSQGREVPQPQLTA